MTFKRHKWEALKPKNNAEALMNGRRRRCVRCGIQQQIAQDTWFPENETKGPCSPKQKG